MRSNFSKNFLVGILIGLIIGCLVGFLLFGLKSKTSSTSPQQTTADGTPVENGNGAACPVCPCKSWSLGVLPAPEWRDDLDKKTELKTDFHGKINLRWKPVDGTRYYVVFYEDKHGRQIKTKTSGSENFTAQDIPLGEGVAEDMVLISVAAANANKEPGIRSKKLQVLVRAPVNTVAPTIKDIKVEE